MYLGALTFVILLGVAALVATRIARRRHIDKFGLAPSHNRACVGLWFGGLSAILALIAFLSVKLFISVVAGILLISQLVGWRSRPWGKPQQVRDGAALACVVSAPLILLALWFSSN
jgi:hypothetical protein